MNYSRFQDLPVWKDSVQVAADVFRFTLQPVFRGKGDLANQLQRAALSISNNIAEGFERQTSRDSCSSFTLPRDQRENAFPCAAS